MRQVSIRRISLPVLQLAPAQLAPAHIEVLTYLAIVLGVSWPLMLASRSAVVAHVAAWVPGGVAAVLMVRAHGRGTLRRLGLDRLGWPDAYFLAIWIPVLLVVGRIATVVALSAGQLDPSVGGLHPASGAAPDVGALERLVAAILLAPFARIVLTLGTELGWRAYVLPRLLTFGSWPAITFTSLLWWLWQLPRVLDPRSPSWPIETVAFLFWCLFIGEILGWLFLRTRSVWAPALFSAVLASMSYLPPLVLRDLSPDAGAYGPAAIIVAAIVVMVIRVHSDGEIVPSR